MKSIKCKDQAISDYIPTRKNKTTVVSSTENNNDNTLTNYKR